MSPSRAAHQRGDRNVNRLDQDKDAIRKNILAAITRMKRQGTVGASISCLMGVCSTRGLTWINPQAYPRIFAEVARGMSTTDFRIYGDNEEVTT